ncbi:DUF6053 domain-containing protein [Pseudoxanthomonas sp. LARHCG66]
MVGGASAPTPFPRSSLIRLHSAGAEAPPTGKHASWYRPASACSGARVPRRAGTVPPASSPARCPGGWRPVRPSRHASTRSSARRWR